jgi:hypothetical protein
MATKKVVKAAPSVPQVGTQYSPYQNLMKFPLLAQPLYTGRQLLISRTEVREKGLGAEVIEETLGIDHILTAIRSVFSYEVDCVLQGRILYIYDLIAPVNFSGRHKRIEETLKPSKVIKAAPVTMVLNEAQVDQLFGDGAERGHVGLILRDPAGLYEHGMSLSSQIVQSAKEEAFKVLGVTLDMKNGNEFVLICEYKGRSFEVPAPFIPQDKLIENKRHYLTREVVVRHNGVGARGLPRAPIGLRFEETLEGQ